jgi:hypothetical protein
MGHFITAKEAMRKYGIRARQIWDVMYRGKIALYDDRGIQVSITEVFEHVTATLGNIHAIYAETPQIARKHPARDAQLGVISKLLFVADEFDRAYKETFGGTDAPAHAAGALSATPPGTPTSAEGQAAPVSVDAPDITNSRISTPTPLIPLNVPLSLWAGKTPQQAYAALKDSFAPEIIAVILEKLDCNKTDGGRLLSPEEVDKKGTPIEKDAGTYQRNVSKLLKKANSKYSLTFDD